MLVNKEGWRTILTTRVNPSNRLTVTSLLDLNLVVHPHLLLILSVGISLNHRSKISTLPTLIPTLSTLTLSQPTSLQESLNTTEQPTTLSQLLNTSSNPNRGQEEEEGITTRTQAGSSSSNREIWETLTRLTLFILNKEAQCTHLTPTTTISPPTMPLSSTPLKAAGMDTPAGPPQAVEVIPSEYPCTTTRTALR